GVARTLANAAVSHHIVPWLQAGTVKVDGFQLFARTERAVLGSGLGPWHRSGGRDVPAAQGALFRVIRHVGAFAGVFLSRTHVDQRVAQVVQDLWQERADFRINALDHRVLGRGYSWLLGAQLAAFGYPFVASAIHQAYIFVAEQREDPQCVGSPPVGLVAVDDHGGLAGDALGGHQLRKSLAIDVVAGDLIVQFGVPVNLQCPWYVAGGIKQDVFIRFQYDQILSSEVLG